jgi:transposase-like protein
MRKLLRDTKARNSRIGQTKSQGKGRVECPHCGHFRTHKVSKVNGGFRRECTDCNEYFNSNR